MEDILVPIGLFGSIAAIIISLSYFKNRRIERTTLIASGKEASIFNEGDNPQLFTSLKYGIFLISIAIGLILGECIANTGILSEPIAYTSMTILFGGIGLVLYYFYENKQRRITDKETGKKETDF